VSRPVSGEDPAQRRLTPREAQLLLARQPPGANWGLVLANPSRYGETTSVAAGVDDPSERRSRTRQGST